MRARPPGNHAGTLGSGLSFGQLQAVMSMLAGFTALSSSLWFSAHDLTVAHLRAVGASVMTNAKPITESFVTGSQGGYAEVLDE